MPFASPALRLLRIRSGIKSGPWADRVQMHRKSYSLVENGHRTASEELFVRCAAHFSDVLGEPVEPRRLMQAGRARDVPQPGHTSAGGPPTEAAETSEAAEAEAEAEALVRGVA